MVGELVAETRRWVKGRRMCPTADAGGLGWVSAVRARLVGRQNVSDAPDVVLTVS